MMQYYLLCIAAGDDGVQQGHEHKGLESLEGMQEHIAWRWKDGILQLLRVLLRANPACFAAAGCSRRALARYRLVKHGFTRGSTTPICPLRGNSRVAAIHQPEAPQGDPFSHHLCGTTVGIRMLAFCIISRQGSTTLFAERWRDGNFLDTRREDT